MHFLRELTCIALILFPVAGLHAGQIYKWTDSEGNVHFGQTPPQEQQASEVTLPRSVTSPRPSQQAAPEDEGEKQPDGATDKLSEHFQQNCEIAKSNLASYRETRRFKEADGSITEISEETRQQKIKEMEDAVSKYCQ